MSIDNSINYNNIILITNNKLCNKLTVNLVSKWDSENGNSKLNIIDLDNNSITTLEKYKNVKKEINSNIIQNIIHKHEIYSYPSILVLRNNSVIEQIFGNYKNIIEIVNFYF
jgi:hypothetical protein